MPPKNCALGKCLIDIKHFFTVVNNKLVNIKDWFTVNKILILKKKAKQERRYPSSPTETYNQ